MNSENIQKIGEYIFCRDGGGRGEIRAADFPSLLMLSKNAVNTAGLAKIIEKTYVPHAVGLADGSEEQIKAALADITENADVFKNLNELNVFIVCATADDTENYARVRERLLQCADGFNFGRLNLYGIYSFNEYSEDKEKIKAHIIELTKYSDADKIVFLGAEHYNRSVDGAERLRRSHTDIAASLIMYCGKMKLENGCFSFGLGRYSDYADEYGIRVLKKCYENRNADTELNGMGDLDGSINNALNAAYRLDTTCPFLEYILKNNVRCTKQTAAEITKELYGDSLEVYFENEAKKYKAALENIGNVVEIAAKNAASASIADVRGKLKKQLETLKERSFIPAERVYMNDAEDISETVRNYAWTRAEELLNEYYVSAYNLCGEILEREYNSREEMKIKQAAELNDIESFIKSVHLHGMINDDNIPYESVNAADKPIDNICGAAKALLNGEGTAAEDYFYADNDKALGIMRALAEPYCRNIADERYFLIGTSEKVNMKNIFGATELSSGGRLYDICLLSCCKAVNIERYI